MKFPLACPPLVGARTTNNELVVGGIDRSRSKKTKTMLRVLCLDSGEASTVLSYLVHFRDTAGNRAILLEALARVTIAKKNYSLTSTLSALVKGSRLHVYELGQGEHLNPILYWSLPKEGMSATEALSHVLSVEIAQPVFHGQEDKRGPSRLLPFAT